MMELEIGSNFFEIETDETQFHALWWEKDPWKSKFYKSGRNALKALVDSLKTKNRVVLLPAYLCGTETEAWYANGWQVHYYPICMDFTIDEATFAELVEMHHPGAIVVQNYYGFMTCSPTAAQMMKQEQNKGAIIIEDITHSWFDGIRLDFCDYYVASLRKFFAIPDGGVLISQNSLPDGEVQPSEAKLTDLAQEAFSLKAQYFETQNQEIKLRYRQVYSDLADAISVNDDVYHMSDLGCYIFRHFKMDFVASRRRENFRYLSKKLADIPFLKLTLNRNCESEIPLYFPVILSEEIDRSALQSFLSSRAIYCPIIWGRPAVLNEHYVETDQLYDRILCIPIDQRYGLEDMERVYNTVCDWWLKQ